VQVIVFPHSNSCYILNSYIAALGVAASDSALLYVILTPAGPYFRGEAKGIPLLAVGESVRSWPGGTGGHKLGLNYAPGFLPQRMAAKQGYSQILWLLGDEAKITEAGAMNFFAVVQRDDGGESLPYPALVHANIHILRLGHRYASIGRNHSSRHHSRILPVPAGCPHLTPPHASRNPSHTASLYPRA
jgi:hypothetical protein